MIRYKTLKELNHDNFSVCEPQTDYSNELFESYLKSFRLTEKTFNISKDVDYIYNRGFKSYINDFQKKGKLPPIVSNETVYLKLHTSDLKSKDCQEANKLYPVDIYCGVFKEGSYNVFEKGKERIVISINKEAIENINYKYEMGTNVKRSIENEITEHRIKAIIYHELAHWISDAKYHSYIHNIVARAVNIPQDDPNRNYKIKQIMNSGKSNVNITHYEIDAQIHAIKQIKRTFKSDWDTMSLLDLFYRYTALKSIAKSLYKINPDVYKLWVKDLVKRMNREGILGKNMRAFPEYKMIENRQIKGLLKV